MIFKKVIFLKIYKYDKSKLPEIVLTKHAELTALSDYVFETAFENIDKPSWKP